MSNDEPTNTLLRLDAGHGAAAAGAVAGKKVKP